MSIKNIFFLIAVGALIFFVLFPPVKPCEEKCNVIVVMVDTLSSKHMDLYGYDRETMPFVSSFFSKGTIYENAYSPSPWTLPSFLSLYFSDTPSNITFADLENESRTSLINVLRNSGYEIRKVSKEGGVFIDDAISRLFREDELVFSSDVFKKGAEEVELLSEKPFFVLIHSFDAHDPYDPKEPYSNLFEKSTREEPVTMNELVVANQNPPVNLEEVYQMALKYDQGLRKVDDDFKKFISSLSSETLRDTYIVFTSDHGEAFGEHGTVWHAQSLYEEEVRIPLLIKSPLDNQSKAGATKQISAPVSLYDIAPTVLSIANIPIPSSFIGTSLFETIQENRKIPLENGRPFFFATSPVDGPIPKTLMEAEALNVEKPIIDVSARGVIFGNWKFMTYKREPYVFDLDEDPEEKKNLYNNPNIFPNALLGS